MVVQEKPFEVLQKNGLAAHMTGTANTDTKTCCILLRQHMTEYWSFRIECHQSCEIIATRSNVPELPKRYCRELTQANPFRRCSIVTIGSWVVANGCELAKSRDSYKWGSRYLLLRMIAPGCKMNSKYSTVFRLTMYTKSPEGARPRLPLSSHRQAAEHETRVFNFFGPVTHFSHYG